MNRGGERRGPQELNDQVGRLKVPYLFFFLEILFFQNFDLAFLNDWYKH